MRFDILFISIYDMVFILLFSAHTMFLLGAMEGRNFLPYPFQKGNLGLLKQIL